MQKKKNALIKSLIGIVVLLIMLIFVMLLIALRPKDSGNGEEVQVTQTTAATVPVETSEEPATEPEPVEATTESTQPPTLPVETEPIRIEYDSVPVYYQTDYPHDRYGYGTVKSSGCSITSLAMVASYLTGHPYTPDELADYFGGYGENNIQRLEYASEKLQLPWKKAENVHEALAAVKSGSVAILLMNHRSIFTESQHFIVLAGINDDGKLIIHDPYEPNYEKWDLKRAFQTGFKEGDVICGYSGGWVYDVDAMPEEPFIYVEDKPYVEPRYPDIHLTWEEQQLLAKVIWVEARGEPKEGQQAIAEIVYNRILSEDFPNTVRDVIYEDNQFRSVKFLDEAEPTQAQYDALDDALEGPYILPKEVLHFATYPVNKNVWGTIGGHVFCYQWS